MNTERRAALYLFCGLMALFLVFYAGVDGYRDIREQLADAENLWLRGDMSIATADGRKAWHPYSVGLPFVSAPFVWGGALVEWITAGAVPKRRIIALVTPLMAAGACVLVFLAGRKAGCTGRASFWAAVVLGVGSPLLSFTQFYYAETAVVFSLALAAWAFLGYRERRRPGRDAPAWLLLAGTGLAGVTACHYANLPLSVALWGAMLATVLLEKEGAGRAPARARARRALELGAVPFAAACALMAVNLARYGSPFETGYSYEAVYGRPLREARREEVLLERERGGGTRRPGRMPAGILSRAGNPWFGRGEYDARELLSFRLSHVGANVVAVGRWLVRVPWMIPAVAALCVLAWRLRRSADAGACLAAGALAALCMQEVLWLLYGYTRFPVFVTRFHLPPVALAALALPPLADRLDRKAPGRGPAYASVVLVAWNLGFFLAGDVYWKPLQYAAGHGLTMRVPAWYTYHAGRQIRSAPGAWMDYEAMWTVHIVVFAALVLAGGVLLALAARQAAAVGREGIPTRAGAEAPTSRSGSDTGVPFA